MCCLSQWHFYVQLLESNYYYATRSRSCLSRRARRVRNILAHFLFCLSGNFLFEKAMSVPLASFAAAATLYVVTIWTEDTQIAPNHVWAILSAG